jgi:hypothetical protein
MILQSPFLENLVVIVKATSKRPINPHNVPFQDQNSYFIPESRALEFRTEPSLGPFPLVWEWFENLKINAIDGDEAIITNISTFPFLPKNLF